MAEINSEINLELDPNGGKFVVRQLHLEYIVLGRCIQILSG